VCTYYHRYQFNYYVHREKKKDEFVFLKQKAMMPFKIYSKQKENQLPILRGIGQNAKKTANGINNICIIKNLTTKI